LEHKTPKPASHTLYEKVNAEELAERWNVPATWIYEQTRRRCEDPIPYVPMGKYLRFEWGSPELESWWQRRKQSFRKRSSKQESGGGSNHKEDVA
jgi:hypothetical protein